MSKGRKNYFDEMKKRKIGDGFFEHIFRLIFFAILLTIEGIFKKLNELRFRLGNFISGRNLSRIISRYNEYKSSIHHLLEKPFYRGKAREHLVQIKDRIFTDRDKKLIFGFRESTHNIVEKSKSALNRFRGYTISVGKKYFKPSPVFNITRNYSASFFTYFLKRDKISGKPGIISRNMKQNREYLKNITDGYKKFMVHTFTKFYSNDFKSKVAVHHTAQMKTFRKNAEKLLKSVEKLKKKQLKSAIEQSIS
jgi:hypothetical protein